MGVRQGPGVIKDPKVLLCDFFDGFLGRLMNLHFKTSPRIKEIIIPIAISYVVSICKAYLSGLGDT